MRLWILAALVTVAAACSSSDETPDAANSDTGVMNDVGADRDIGGFDASALLDAAEDSGARDVDDSGNADDGVSDSEPVDSGDDDLGATDARDAGPVDNGKADAGTVRPLSVLVFSRTEGFRHGSISNGITALTDIATAEGWQIEATEDLARITPGVLAGVDVFVALNTTGDFLGDTEQANLQTWYRAGGGFVGIHAAADAEYNWPWYSELVGAWFDRHPASQNATLNVEDRTHPATMHLGTTWMRRDEWYDFRQNPRANVQVLISIDESTYNGGGMGADHPMTWARAFDGGRTFYTAFGHTAASYAEPDFRTLLTEAIRWTGGP